jgi:tetratricopeptide (TPR) repeat protein
MEKRCTDALQSLRSDHQEKRARILFRRALLRLELNKMDAAAQDIEEAASLAPDDFDIRYHRGRVSTLARGNVDEAMKSAERMIRENPNAHQGYFLKAECELFQRQNAFALRNLDEAKDRAPDSVQVRIRRAFANSNLGRFSAVIEDVDVALRLRPCFESYDASLHQFRGCASYGQGDYAAATASLLRCVNQKLRWSRPIDDDVYVALWYSYTVLGKPTSAMWAAAELKRQFPKQGASHSIWALCEANAGDFDSALKSAKKGVELAPKQRLPNAILGKLQIARGDYEEGLESLQRGLLQADTGRIDLDVALHIAYVKSVAPDSRLRDGVEAVRLTELAMKPVEPGFHPSVLVIRACATAENGDFESAFRWISEYLASKDLDNGDREAAESIQNLIRSKKAFHIGEAPAARNFALPLVIRLNGNVYCE